MSVRLLIGDCRSVLKTLPDESVHCVVTSPPYFGLRDYGTAKWEGGDEACGHVGPPMRTNNKPVDNSATFHGGTSRGTEPMRVCHCGARRIDSQIGLEPTPDAYVAEMVAVFREVRRVMRRDATAWINLGDAFASKQLLGIPWRVAFALQADGWWLRSEIIWAKSNPMPESVTDRPTKAHEQIFLLTRSATYWYDAEAVREEAAPWNSAVGFNKDGQSARNIEGRIGNRSDIEQSGRNKRSVWTVPSAPFSEAHFATFPPALIEPCIKAGCPEGGVVLDPFGGAGTTGLVADRLGRNAILIELNPAYAAMGRNRIVDDGPLFAQVTA